MEKTPFKQLIDAVREIVRRSSIADECALTEKVLDLWFTNLNYYETRFGDEMSECLEPSASDDAIGASMEALRTVWADATLRINRYSCDELRGEFSQRWALPRCYEKRSKRNAKTYATFLGSTRDVPTSLDAFHANFRRFVREGAFERLEAEILDEIAFYDELRERFSENAPVAYRMMLPIWILKEASPLYALSIWTDAEKVGEICEAIGRGFLDHKDEFSATRAIESRDCEEYAGKVTRLSTDLAKCGWADPGRFGDMSVRELYEELYGDRIDPLYQDLPEDFPAYAVLEAKLLWNLIGGSIFGPQQSTGSLAISTALAATEDRIVGSADAELVEGRGKAIFRQLSVWDEGDPASTRYAFEVDLGSEDFETETPDEGLAAVIGRSYVPGYQPTLHISEGERRATGNLARIAEQVGLGEPPIYFDTDMPKDSAWHLGVFLAGKPRRLYLVDLGSLNGSYVIRKGEDGRNQAFAFTGRNADRPREKVVKPMRELGIDPDAIEVVGCLEARRQDIVMLGSSQFEIL